MRFEFIAEHRETWPVSWICEALGVSWHAAFMPGRFGHPVPARSDEEFGARIRASISSYRTYGARRGWNDPSGRRPFMRSGSCRAADACSWPEGSSPASWPAKDDGLRSIIADTVLDRQFTAEAPNQRWIADFTPAFAGAGSTSGRRGMAVRRRRYRPVFAPGGRLVDERHHGRPARHRCADDGDLAAREALLHHSDQGGAAQGSGDAQHRRNGCGGSQYTTKSFSG